ncbi:DUF3263 domain-containing protein [Rhodococcus erythropolis]|uniref:DUF3263 domain-containing protein n=1 Tax=Rhodococcus erythropolis TaxID=1833 RepID=UPI003B00DC9C
MRRIDTHDNAILDLARRWAPYGSVPTSEIWLTCGMRPNRFYTTLARILGTLAARELSPDQCQSLKLLVMRHTTNRHERATRDACCEGAE